MSRILAIDYGKKRTGVAVTDVLQIIANGLTTVPTHQLLDFILKYVEKEPVERIIVGHPKQMNNQESENMRNIVPFVNQLRKKIPDIPVEVSLWPGMKFTGQIVFPVYNDGYGETAGKIHPGYLTLAQKFRLPYNIQSTVTIGMFDYNTYGADLNLFYPFKDERFSLEGRIGYVGFGYWHGFKFRYNDKYTTYWSVGGNFYWPRYNTQFKLRAEQYLLKEKGVRFEMIRHFRYASIGFYAVKAEHANSNGGFKFIVALPPYKYKRHKYIPRVSTSLGTGITYNAGNEKYYYKMPYSNASDNIMQQNSFNPYFIKSELLNF
jgi:hypothetical protein